MTVTLPPEVERIARAAVARGEYDSVVDFLAAAARRTEQAASPKPVIATDDGQRSAETAYDVAKQRGVIGMGHGPGDLTTNPEHMRGFGE